MRQQGNLSERRKMKKQTRFGFQVAWELHKTKMQQGEFAAIAGLSQGAISLIISNERKRADPATLKAICQAWPDYDARVRCIVKHLQDELHRAGFDPDATIDLIPKRLRNANERQRVLAELTARALLDNDIYALLVDLLNLVSKIPAAQPEQPGLAADPHGPEYST